MNFETISRASFAQDMGLHIEGGTAGARGLAGLLRQPLARWGLSPRRAVIRYVREQLNLIEGNETSSILISEVLDRLVVMGDCDDVKVGAERYIAPGLHRWIATGNSTGVLLGVGPVPAGIEVLEPVIQDDIARRIRVDCDEGRSVLHDAGFQRSELAEWLGPLAYLKHARRRLGQPIRDDKLPLKEFWELLIRDLLKDGRPLGADAEVRILTGTTGSYFGNYSGADLEGRWSGSAEDGVWCAYRRGYCDGHWHPIIISIDSGVRRILDLYDNDEMQWALLACGLATGNRERINLIGTMCQFTCPIPIQLRATMDLLGPRAGPWRWHLSEGAPELLASIFAI